VQRQKWKEKEIIAILSSEILKLMLQVVWRWTKDTPLVQADEIKSITEVLRCCILVDSKNWAFRAIQYGLTVVSYEGLVDFLNLARGNTYGVFKSAKSNKTYCMYIVVSDTPKAHIDNNFRFGN
jgi:hypothetical protein